MGIMYSAGAASTAATNASDATSLKAVNNSFALREYVFSGLATASAANEWVLQRNTTGAITTTLNPVGGLTSTSITVYANAIATATTALSQLHRFGCNGNGALFRWVAAPGLAVEARTAGQIGWRALSGTSLTAMSCIIEEF